MFIRSAKEMGVLVRSERERRRWSQTQLAERVGVSLPWISQFERGKPTAQIDLVLKTLAALGIRLWAGDPPAASGPGAPQIDLDQLLDGFLEGTPTPGGDSSPPLRSPKRR